MFSWKEKKNKFCLKKKKKSFFKHYSYPSSTYRAVFTPLAGKPSSVCFLALALVALAHTVTRALHASLWNNIQLKCKNVKLFLAKNLLLWRRRLIFSSKIWFNKKLLLAAFYQLTCQLKCKHMRVLCYQEVYCSEDKAPRSGWWYQSQATFSRMKACYN